MNKSPQTFLTNLGTGVGLRPEHYKIFLDEPPKTVNWVEVISENFMPWRGGFWPSRPIKMLESVRKNYEVALHGVSLSIGSADPIDHDYLRRLKELINRIEPHHVSDHLCWTSVDGENLHDLLPMPYTRKALQFVISRVKQVQDILGRQILLENPSSYVEFDFNEMAEWEFMVELAEKADCGILLDINNVFVSGVNHGFDPLEYLRAIPMDRVGQVHVAGHTRNKKVYIDTHDEPVSQEVWDLLRWFKANKGSASAMVERDGNIPAWGELEQEAKMITKILCDSSVERKVKSEKSHRTSAIL